MADNDQLGSDGKFCRRCGEDNPEHARFCRRCGALLDGSLGAWDMLRKGMDMDTVQRLLGTPENTSASRHVIVWRYAVETLCDEDMRSAHVLFDTNQTVRGWNSSAFGAQRLEGQLSPEEFPSMESIYNAVTNAYRAADV